jgi:cell division cycle 20-like protein 1 (cofactor of APC complex)
VYLWQASTGKVTKLCDAGVSVTSVQWADTRDNPTLAVGLENGYIQLWDASKCAMIRAFAGHKERVSSFAWNASMVSSGSRDRTIRHWDSRSATMAGSRLTAHTQEVCGLKWNVQEQLLASGGNDNRLCIWSGLNPSPLYEFTEHRAAVKALAWSPHHSSTLASGGGTIDRCIRIWNAKTGLCLNKVDTGSQVCNLAWSRTSSEIVSTHGYSHNQIVVWKYPSMHPMATLTGHTSRVLYLACGPDNESIVTGAADETLRFWKVFTPNETRTLGSTLRAQDIR